MKKQVLFLCFASALLLSGCGGNSPETGIAPTTAALQEETTVHISAEDYEFPEYVNIPENACYCRADNFGEYAFYDEYGNVIQVNGEDFVETHDYQYNDDGTIAVEAYNDGFISAVHHYTYNSDKTLLTAETEDEDTYTLFKYDKHGQVVRELIMSKTDADFLILTDYKNIYKNGRLVTHREKGNSQIGTETTYEYDEKGRISREIVNSTCFDMIISDCSYTYYSDGKVKTEIHRDEEGIMYSLEYEYVYI